MIDGLSSGLRRVVAISAGTLGLFVIHHRPRPIIDPMARRAGVCCRDMIGRFALFRLTIVAINAGCICGTMVEAHVAPTGCQMACLASGAGWQVDIRHAFGRFAVVARDAVALNVAVVKRDGLPVVSGVALRTFIAGRRVAFGLALGLRPIVAPKTCVGGVVQFTADMAGRTLNLGMFTTQGKSGNAVIKSRQTKCRRSCSRGAEIV